LTTRSIVTVTPPASCEVSAAFERFSNLRSTTRPGTSAVIVPVTVASDLAVRAGNWSGSVTSAAWLPG
jgi:hypothetical protein